MGCGSSSAADGPKDKTVLDVEYKEGSNAPKLKQLTGTMLRPDLTTINAKGNEIKTLPSEIKDCTTLTSLDMSDNTFDTIPVELAQCKALEELLLFKNDIKDLPKELGDLSALKNLNLFNNKLKKIPDAIGQLSALEEVNFAANKIMMVSDKCMANWSSVKILNLYDNNIVKLGSLAPLTALEELRLYNTPLDSLPDLGADGKANLAILEVHHSSNKGMVEVVPDTYFEKTPSLNRLTLYGNTKLKKLPQSVLTCKNLKGLLVNDCALTELPGGSKWPLTLEALFVNGNAELTELPAELTKINVLKRVNLSGCTSLSPASMEVAKKIQAICANNKEGKYWAPDGTVSG